MWRLKISKGQVVFWKFAQKSFLNPCQFPFSPFLFPYRKSDSAKINVLSFAPIPYLNTYFKHAKTILIFTEKNTREISRIFYVTTAPDCRRSGAVCYRN